MKKLMKKKVNLFGKEISVLLLVVVGMAALVSAALVGYISNPVSATVKVDSPLSMLLSKDGSTGWAKDIILEDMYGGQDKVFYSEIVNHINESIVAVFTVTITNTDADATCADFTWMTINGVGAAPVLGAGCEEVAGAVVIEGTQSMDPLETDNDDIGFEFALDVKPSTYVISTQIMKA